MVHKFGLILIRITCYSYLTLSGTSWNTGTTNISKLITTGVTDSSGYGLGTFAGTWWLVGWRWGHTDPTYVLVLATTGVTVPSLDSPLTFCWTLGHTGTTEVLILVTAGVTLPSLYGPLTWGWTCWLGKAVICGGWYRCWFEARLLSWSVAPFLDNWLLDFSGIGLWPCTDLLGYICAGFMRLQLGDQLGHMFTLTLGLKAAKFLRFLPCNGHLLLIALLGSRYWGTWGRSTQFNRNLGTLCLWCVLGHTLLGNIASE